MIPHHQQAVEMSELADGRAEDAEITWTMVFSPSSSSTTARST
ncbi:DUF305 domain-containing protein [Streptomyces decoyicus]